MESAYVPASLVPVKYKGSFFRFRNNFTKYGYVAFLLLVILFSTLVIIANLFEKPINRRVLAAVKGQLKTELKVQDMSLSLVNAFPYASVELKGVTLRDVAGKQLLGAKRISLQFGIFSLLSSNIKVRSLVVENGQLRIHTDKKGNPNYLVFKTASSGSASKDIAFSLASAYLEKLRLIYTDDREQRKFDITVDKAQAKGDFTATNFVTDCKAAITVNTLAQGSSSYLRGKKLSYDGEVEVDLKNQIYRLHEALLNLESSVVSVDGAFQVKKDHTYCDLSIKNKRTNLPTLLQLLPEPYAGYFSDFKSTGNFDLNGKIKGRVGKSDIPAIDIVMQMHDATVRSPKLEDALEDVNFKAVLKHNKETSFFEISGFKGQFGKNPLTLQLKVTDLADPLVDFRFDGIFPLASAFGLLNNPAITAGEGKLVFKDLRLKGRYKDMIHPARIQHVLATGHIAMRDAALTVNKEAVAFPSGLLILDGNRLQLDSFRIEGAGSSLVLNGYCQNLVPVLFADSLNSQHAVLDFNSNLYAKSLDIDKLLALAVRQQKAEKIAAATTVNTTTRKRVSPFRLLKGTFDAQIDQLNYDLIETKDFSGQLTFENGDMYVNGDLEGMDGIFNVEGIVDLDVRSFEAAVECKDVNITEFFRQCRNFYQDFVEDKNLKGKLNAQMIVRGNWNQDFSLNQDKLQAFADFSVNNGELIRFKMLDYFSKFIKVQDLQHIKFTNLRNWVEISHKTIYMPAIFVQSNAANLTFSGKHSFDQRINYNIMVNAGQVLTSKLKKYDNHLNPQPAEKGWFNLYYNISGTTSKYQMRLAKNTVVDEFASSEMRKHIIQRELAKVFGSSARPPDGESGFNAVQRPSTAASVFGKVFSTMSKTSTKKSEPVVEEEEEDYFVPGF